MSNATTESSRLSGSSPQPVFTHSQLREFFSPIVAQLKHDQTTTTDPSSRLVVAADLGHFFKTINRQVKVAETKQRRIDKRQAPGFNVFHLIEPDENKLSDIIADLLNPQGGHGQRDLFLRLLLKRLGLSLNGRITHNAVVCREAPTHGIQKYLRRMDVFVEAGALLAIENKVDSIEQRDQVKDYLQHLRQCADGRPIRLIYLTPDGRPPDSLAPAILAEERNIGRLYCWSYQRELRSWLESCRGVCAAQKIQFFLLDFIAYIEAVLKRDPWVTNQDEGDDD